MQFATLANLGHHFRRTAHHLPAAIHVELDDLSRGLVAETRKHFGTYGPDWPQLKAATQADRVRLGFTPNDPLFRTGALQASVHAKVSGHDALFVGTDEESEPINGKPAWLIAAVHENGTVDGRVPARPVYPLVIPEIPRFVDAFALGLWARARV